MLFGVPFPPSSQGAALGFMLGGPSGVTVMGIGVNKALVVIWK